MIRVLTLALGLTALPLVQIHAQSSGSSIVEEALKGVREDQARDAERVRRMVDEAVKGSETAQSGKEAVNPQAPATLQPLQGENAQRALPVGYQADHLLDRPVENGAGARIGVIRDLVRDEGSGVARAMVEFTPLFDQPGKTSAVPIEALTTTTARGEGYVMELTSVAFAGMPPYVRQGGRWLRQDG